MKGVRKKDKKKKSQKPPVRFFNKRATNKQNIRYRKINGSAIRVYLGMWQHLQGLPPVI